MNFLRRISDNIRETKPSSPPPIIPVAPFSELQKLYDRVISYISSKDNNDLVQFKSILEETIQSNPFKNDRISNAEINDFTLMQHCCRHEGLEEFVQLLLNARVNPNVTLSGETHEENEKHCSILAAEIANYKVLEVLIKYNQPTFNEEEDSERYESGKPLPLDHNLSMRTNKHRIIFEPCDFNKYTNANETILHVLLQRPLIQGKISKEYIMGTGTWKRKKTKELKTEATKINKKYQKCIDLLLDENTLNDNLNYREQIRKLINIKDKPYGNTALHYAVNNWSKKVVTQILQAGGNPAVKNLDGEKPLTKIKLKTMKKFLDSCMEPVPDEYYVPTVSNGRATKTKEVNKLKAGYRIKKLLDKDTKLQVDDVPINFRIGFLAPAITDPMTTENTVQTNSACREMSAMQCISDSKAHNELVTHPVLKAYNWTKWKLLSRAYNRSLRIQILFAMCLTWFIFDQFGGRKWKHIGVFGNFRKWKKENLTDDFNHHQCFDSYLFNDSVYSFGSLTFNRNVSHYGDREDEMYYAFSIHALVQLFFIIWDFLDSRMIKTITYQRLKTKAESVPGIIFSTIRHSFQDLVTVTLIMIVLVGSREILWFVLHILLIFEYAREAFQLLASIKTYFRQFDNYLDLLFLFVVELLVLIPDKDDLIKDTCRLSLDTNVDDACDKMKETVFQKCKIKRCFAAFIIVIMWIRVFKYIALHPKLDKLNLYVSMFNQVRKTFLEFIWYYAIYIISFGMGFYILLHTDTEITWASGNGPNNILTETELSCPAAKDPCDCAGPHYKTPWYSFARTFLMFLGELDYNDFLDRVEGGNITETMSLAFFLFFVFMLNMVLLNLLNAMAISDTACVVKKSKIICETSMIKTIGYMEFCIYNHLKTMHKIATIFRCSFSLESLLGRSGTMLFQSSYLDESNSVITLGEKTITRKADGQWFRWRGGGEGEQILFEARQILQKRKVWKEKDSKDQDSSSSSSESE